MKKRDERGNKKSKKKEKERGNRRMKREAKDNKKV